MASLLGPNCIWRKTPLLLVVILTTALHSHAQPIGSQEWLRNVIQNDKRTNWLLKDTLLVNSCSFSSITKPLQLQLLVSVPTIKNGEVTGYTTSSLGADSSLYFYPASLVKLPTILAAMQKANATGAEWNQAVPLTGSAPCSKSEFSKQARSSLLKHYKDMSLASLTKRIALVSDNEAYNRLLDFAGPLEVNALLAHLGYGNSQVFRRFKTCCESCNTIGPASELWQVNARKKPVLKGKWGSTTWSPKPGTFYSCLSIGDPLKSQPKDFSQHNRLLLRHVHDLWLKLVWPQLFPSKKGWPILTEAQRVQFLQWCSQSPREGDHRKYQDEKLYPTYLKKYLVYGSPSNDNDYVSYSRNGRTVELLDEPVSTNIVGQSYGWYSDVSWLHDPESSNPVLRAGIVISVVVYADEDGIAADGVYNHKKAMESIGAIGRVLWKGLIPDEQRWQRH